jgi:predicted transcriptional regulator
MLKSVSIGARISPKLDASLERLAHLTGRPKSWHLCEAIQSYVTTEQEFIEAVKEGLEDLQAGRVVEHEKVAHHFEKRFKKASRR